jgi:hypothetical protein
MMKLFETGQVVGTPGALSALADAGTDPMDLLNRHVSGDYGDICPEDAKENAFSIAHGFRIISIYNVGTERVWLISEADRSSSTFLLGCEY